LNGVTVRATDESTGLGLLRRARQRAGLGLRYESESIGAYLQYRYQGERPDVDPVTFARISDSPYGVFDVGGSYKLSPGHSIIGRVENVFDQKFVEVAGYGSPGVSAYFGLAGEL
jgi:vitamin B12 transporter